MGNCVSCEEASLMVNRESGKALMFSVSQFDRLIKSVLRTTLSILG
jgi:hypothetical protein